MITEKIKIKTLTKDERKVFRGPAKEAAREAFGVDPFDDEILELELFQTGNQEGNTLPVLRRYKLDRHMPVSMLICTDEQLDTMRSLYVTEVVAEVSVDTSEDVIHQCNEMVPVKLGEINCFFTETGIHSLDPLEELYADYYVEAIRGCNWDYEWFYVIEPDSTVNIVPREGKYKEQRVVRSRTRSTVLVPTNLYL